MREQCERAVCEGGTREREQCGWHSQRSMYSSTQEKESKHTLHMLLVHCITYEIWLCLRAADPHSHNQTSTRITARMLNASLLLCIFGLLMAVVNATAPTLIECVDYGILLSISHVDFASSPLHQWLFVIAVSLLQVSASAGLLHARSKERVFRARSIAVLNTFAALSTSSSRSIHSWRMNAIEGRTCKPVRAMMKSCYLTLCYCGLFLVLAIPDAAYVLTQNVPRDNPVAQVVAKY